jgi:uncharacterized protein (TIGR03435 family)
MRGSVVVLLVCGVVSAQDPPRPMAFDAASIKRNLSNDDFADGGFAPGGRITAVNVTLANLITAAYAIAPERIEGGPAWVRQDRFDVVATGNRTASVADTRQMLRNLLAERFALVTKNGTRERPIFTLTSTRRDRRPGTRLRATTPECAAKRVSVESAAPEAGPPSPSRSSVRARGVRRRTPERSSRHNCANRSVAEWIGRPCRHGPQQHRWAVRLRVALLSPGQQPRSHGPAGDLHCPARAARPPTGRRPWPCRGPGHRQRRPASGGLRGRPWPAQPPKTGDRRLETVPQSAVRTTRCTPHARCGPSRARRHAHETSGFGIARWWRCPAVRSGCAWCGPT